MKIKKYFYVLRPVLAAGWIEKFNEFPPLEFTTLLQRIVPEGPLKSEINTLLKRKLDGDELDIEPKIHVINNFLIEEITRLREYIKTLNIDIPNFTSNLDFLFRDTLEEVWK